MIFVLLLNPGLPGAPARLIVFVGLADELLNKYIVAVFLAVDRSDASDATLGKFVGAIVRLEYCSLVVDVLDLKLDSRPQNLIILA